MNQNLFDSPIYDYDEERGLPTDQPSNYLTSLAHFIETTTAHSKKESGIRNRHWQVHTPIFF